MLDPFNSTELQLNILMFHPLLASRLFSSLLFASHTHTHIFCVFVGELHFRSMLYAKSLKAFTVSAIASVSLELDPFSVGIVVLVAAAFTAARCFYWQC